MGQSRIPTVGNQLVDGIVKTNFIPDRDESAVFWPIEMSAD
jgi:hypothetical protein